MKRANTADVHDQKEGADPCSTASVPPVEQPTRDASLSQMEPAPVFLDRMYTIIDTASDDVVSWSDAGDSFTIRKVKLFEGLLPAFYNHKNFLSFVRQLNFYGFSKVKGTVSRSSSAKGGDAADCGGKRPRQDSQCWEYMHPKFRRGRKDLLAGIKRRKDSGRWKRRRVDPQSDMLVNLKREVEQVAADLQAVDNKVDGIKSLVLGMAVEAGAHANPLPAQDGGLFGHGVNPPFVPTPAPHGGFERWGSGGAGVAGPDPYTYGTPLAINYVIPHHPMDQKRWSQPCSPLQCVPREQYFMPYQPQFQAPPSSSRALGHAAVSRQLPLDGPPSAHYLTAGRKEGPVSISSTVPPPNRGGSDHQQTFPARAYPAAKYGTQRVWYSSPSSSDNPESPGEGDHLSEMQQSLSEGKMSMLEVLSLSAASAVETEIRERSKSSP